MNKCQKLCPIYYRKLLLIDKKETSHKTESEQLLCKLWQFHSPHIISSTSGQGGLIMGFLMQCNIELLVYNTLISYQHLFTLYQQLRKCNINVLSLHL